MSFRRPVFAILLPLIVLSATPSWASACTDEVGRIAVAVGGKRGPWIGFSQHIVHPDAFQLYVTCLGERPSGVRGIHQGSSDARPFLRVLARVGALALTLPEPELRAALDHCARHAAAAGDKPVEASVSGAAVTCSASADELSVEVLAKR